MTTIQDKIAELREAEKLAAKGPWVVELVPPHEADSNCTWWEVAFNGDMGWNTLFEIEDAYSNHDTKHDAAFIALARNSLPDILDYISRLEKVVDAAIRCRNENIKGIEAIIGAEAWAVDDLDEALRELHK